MYNKKDLIDAIKENGSEEKVLKMAIFALKEAKNDISSTEDIKTVLRYLTDSFVLSDMILRKTIREYFENLDLGSEISCLNEICYIDMNTSKYKLNKINSNFKDNNSKKFLETLNETNKLAISYVGEKVTGSILNRIKSK